MPLCLTRLTVLTVVNCMLTLADLLALTTGSTYAKCVQKFFGLPNLALGYQETDTIVVCCGELM